MKFSDRAKQVHARSRGVARAEDDGRRRRPSRPGSTASRRSNTRSAASRARAATARAPHPDLFPANNPVLRPPVAGRVGLWAKTDSTSYFKDYVVERRSEHDAEEQRPHAVRLAAALLLCLCPAAQPAARAVAEHRGASSCSSSIRPARSSATPTVIGHQQRDRRDARGARPAPTAAATFPALPLTGTYTVARDEAGLHRRGRQRPHAARRRDGDGEGEAGRRAAARPRSPSTAPTRACAPTRRSAGGSTARPSTRRRSSAARSRRCRSSTRRSARARARATSSSTPPTSSPASGSRRTTTFMLDGASNDEGWGRQTMLATVPVGAVQEVVGADQRVLGRVRLDRRARR